MTAPYLRTGSVLMTMLSTLATAAALCAQGQNNSETLETGAIVVIVLAAVVVIGTFIRIIKIER